MTETKASVVSRTVRSVFPVFRVVSVAESSRWYRDVLGFSAESFGNSADPSFAILRCDGVEIALQKVGATVGEPRSATKVGGGWDAYLRIYDARTFRESVRARLSSVGPIETTEYGCQEFTVTDLDGHVIVIGECT